MVDPIINTPSLQGSLEDTYHPDLTSTCIWSLVSGLFKEGDEGGWDSRSPLCLLYILPLWPQRFCQREVLPFR